MPLFLQGPTLVLFPLVRFLIAHTILSLYAYWFSLTLAFVLRCRTEGPLEETEEDRIRLSRKTKVGSVCVSGVPKTTPRFADLLGEFSGLSI